MRKFVIFVLCFISILSLCSCTCLQDNTFEKENLTVNTDENSIVILPIDKKKLPLVIVEKNNLQFFTTPEAEPESFPLTGNHSQTLIHAYQADLNNDGVYEAYATFLNGLSMHSYSISGYDPVSQKAFHSKEGNFSFLVYEGKLFVSERKYFPFTSQEGINQVYHPIPNINTLTFDFEEIGEEFVALINQALIPKDTQVSGDFYPEWIYLSENVYMSGQIFSPIDHQYNLKSVEQDFIDSTSLEFIDIWLEELKYQYNKTLEYMPEEYQKYKDQFIKQQEAWQEYEDNDTFNLIGGELGYGYIREWHLKRMDRIRARTIEIMQIQALSGIDVAFLFEAN